ncbi:MAG: molybdopterin-dependent oxidoreductase [Caldilineaceae bacterium]
MYPKKSGKRTEMVSPEATSQRSAAIAGNGKAKGDGSRIETVPGLCGVCDSGCSIVATVTDGVLTSVAPRAGHPRGICCPRGMHAPEIVYSPDRVLTPLRRVGPKGTEAFEAISWDEALDTIAARVRQVAAEYGPEAVCMYTGRGSFERSLQDLFGPADIRESSASSLFFPLGSPNTTGVGAICYVARAFLAPQTTFGAYWIDMFDDVENADLIVVWGANPATDSPPTMLRRILRAKRRGAEVVCIDHRLTETAKATDAQWIGIRPGTDGALALGMIRVLIEEQLYDRDFVEQWTVGFDELREYVQQFTPEEVERITWVPADSVRNLARRVAGARGAAQVMYTGLEYTDSGVQNIRAALILWALAGKLDVPGGVNFKMPNSEFPIHGTKIAPPLGVDPVGKDKFPLYYHFRREAHSMALPAAILEGEPYLVRAMVIGGASMLTSYPQPALWRRCFEALDFLVVVDHFITADAMYADIVLPSATLFEIESYVMRGNFIQWRPRIIEPVGEARPDAQIYAAIAERLGYGDRYPQNVDDMLELVLEESDIDVEMLRASQDGITLPSAEMVYRKWERGLLRKDGRPGFETPTGKLEIASSLLARYGYDALPVYTEPAIGPLNAPELAQTYPLVFNSGARTQTDFRSQLHNIPGLSRKAPAPLVLLHPRDAEQRGIADGDEVLVVTPRGRVPYLARVSDRIVPGVVEANMGGGGPLGNEAWRRANVNELTEAAHFDPISGFPIYKTLLCDVVKPV